MTGRRVPLPLGALALGALLGCSGITTSYDFDPSVDFENLETFGWMPVRSSELTQFERERVTQAVESGLTERGYRQAANADFLLQVYAGKERSLGTGYGWSGMDMRVYEEGTLVIDIVDPRTDKLIWRGTAVGTLKQDPTPEEQSENLAKAVKAVLANFPPGSRP